MADCVIVKQPNPQITQPVAEQYNPIKMFDGEVVVMPYGYCTINKMTSGVVGKLKEDYLYPQYLFFDAGCGQTVLEFDQELPENWEQVYQKVANEPFEDPELDALLPDEVFQFEQAFTLDKQLETYIKNIQQYKETGIDDDYINSQIIPELIPYIEGQMPVEQLTVVDDTQEAVINQGMRVISRTVDGGIIVNLGGGNSREFLLNKSADQLYSTRESCSEERYTEKRLMERISPGRKQITFLLPRWDSLIRDIKPVSNLKDKNDKQSSNNSL